jgi:hypothetical protein
MKHTFTILLCLAALFSGKAQQVSTPMGSMAGSEERPRPLPVPDNPSGGAGANPILGGVYLKSDWHSIKNPFRFEIQEEVADLPDRNEQMELIGLSKIPDEEGIVRTYAFVVKTSETRAPVVDTKGKKVEPKPKRDDKTLQETYVLQAFPEILDESTTPTEEQAEKSSIMLTSEQLWFVGAISLSNKTSAVFWPVGSYPVKEESLRQFDLTDSLLKDLPDRRTKAGEKIGGEKGVNVLARVNKAKQAKDAGTNPQNKTDALNAAKQAPAVPKGSAPPRPPELPVTAQSPGPISPASKPPQSGNVQKDVKKALQGP